MFILDTVGDVDLLQADHASAAPNIPTSTCQAILLSDEESKDPKHHEEAPRCDSTRPLELDLEDDEEDDSDSDLRSPEMGLFQLPGKSVDIQYIIHEALQWTQVPPSPVELEMEKYRDRLRLAMEKRSQRLSKKKLKPYVDLDHTEEEDQKEAEMPDGRPIDDQALIKTDVSAVLAKSNISVGLEQRKSLPRPSKRQQQRESRVSYINKK